MKTNFEIVKSQFNPSHWKSIDDYEVFYLKYIQETYDGFNYYTERKGTEVKIPPENHYPELKEYEVWVNLNQDIKFLGKTYAKNFKEACEIVYHENRMSYFLKIRDYISLCLKNTKEEYIFENLYRIGCKLYWSEELARKSFG